jgi:hypothetical protein
MACSHIDFAVRLFRNADARSERAAGNILDTVIASISSRNDLAGARSKERGVRTSEQSQKAGDAAAARADLRRQRLSDPKGEKNQPDLEDGQQVLDL